MYHKDRSSEKTGLLQGANEVHSVSESRVHEVQENKSYASDLFGALLQEEEKQRKKKRKVDTRGKSLNEVLPAPKNQSSTMGLLGGGTGSVCFLHL